MSSRIQDDQTSYGTDTSTVRLPSTCGGHARPRRHDERSVRASLGDGREQFELSGPSFAGEEVYATCIDTRGAGAAAVHRIGQQPLGAGAPALRRPRCDLDRGRTGIARVPGGQRRIAGQDLATHPRTRRSTRRRVRRCRTGGTVPQRRRRAQLRARARALGPPAPARSGNRVAAGCASTRCSCTRTTPTASSSPSRRPAST